MNLSWQLKRVPDEFVSDSDICRTQPLRPNRGEIGLSREIWMLRIIRMMLGASHTEMALQTKSGIN